jgi:RNA polymerase primary sigma factor
VCSQMTSANVQGRVTSRSNKGGVLSKGEPTLDSRSQFLDDIGRYPLLTRDQERQLSILALSCEAARKILAAWEEGELPPTLRDSEARALALAPNTPSSLTHRAEDVVAALAERDEEEAQLAFDAPGSDEEVAALRRLEIDGENAQDRLVCHNLRLVVAVSRDFTRSGLPFEDLIALGYQGLMHAARRYDGTRDVAFSRYGVFWIKQRLLKGTVEEGFDTRVPPHRAAAIHRVRRVSAKLMQSLAREATPEEIAAETGYHMSEVGEIQRLLQPAVELDSAVKGDPAAGDLRSYFGESAADAADREQRNVVQIACQRQVASALSLLTEREAFVLRMHFGLEGEEAHDLEAVGRMLNPPVTRERARQIRAAAIEKIRQSGVVLDPRDG